MARAWIFQRKDQVEKYGAQRASWYVGWVDPDGHQVKKSCGAGQDGKRNATKVKRQVEAELLTGTYSPNAKKTWEEFVKEYEERILTGKARSTRTQALMSLANFSRLVSLKRVSGITTRTIDAFIAARRSEPKRYRPEDTVSVASVNADLRNIKAALSVAHDWGCLEEMPRVRMLREPRKLPVYVLPEHFASIYQACDKAKLPEGNAPDWWRGLLVLAYQATGWRIGQLLSLSRSDVNLDAGTAIARASAEGNKARRDVLVKLHSVAVDHLRLLAGFSETLFPWPHNRRTLSAELSRLCRLAGVPSYGFHAFRKGFGSLNAPRLSAGALQHLMQHASLNTTLKFYANPLAEQEAAVEKLNVPDILKGRTG